MWGAKVSEKHANWIENINSAISYDVENIIYKIKDDIYKLFNVELSIDVLS
jgi:UDP-N-acetylenolpyruvoylglucosamine reductase